MPLRPIEMYSVDRITALVIGDAGVGKTSLLRTIPEDEKVICLSAESGLLAVRDLVKAGRVEGFEIGSFHEMKEALQFLATEKEAQQRYQWVFIDSLTEISGRCVEAMQSKYPSKSDSFAMWGDYANLMTGIIKSFRDLHQYSVVFTCLTTVEKDESNRRYIGPAIAGSQLKDRLTSYFDEVFYMLVKKDENGQNQRMLITQPVERYPAKDRSGKLNVTEYPDLAAIKNKIIGE